jgi:hypothetical protein
MLLRHLSSFLNWWKSFWFPDDTGLRLALCRIIVVGAQLFIFFPSLDSQLMFLRPFRGFIDPQVIMVAISAVLPAGLFPTAGAFQLIYWVALTAGLTTLIGLFTRTSAFVFGLGNWLVISHVYSYGEEHHPEAILAIFLMLLAFSPSGKRLSIDAFLESYRQSRNRPRLSETVWPLKLTQVLLCFAYVSTGLAKVLYGGFEWMNGYTLQQIILSSAVARDIPLGIWLAQQHTLCILLSVGVIMFEVFFFVSLLVPRTLPYFLLGGMLLHLGIYFSEGSDFFQYIILYSVFLDFDKWIARLNIRSNPRYTNDPVQARRMTSGGLTEW